MNRQRRREKKKNQRWRKESDCVSWQWMRKPRLQINFINGVFEPLMEWRCEISTRHLGAKLKRSITSSMRIFANDWNVLHWNDAPTFWVFFVRLFGWWQWISVIANCIRTACILYALCDVWQWMKTQCTMQRNEHTLLSLQLLRSNTFQHAARETLSFFLPPR